MVVHEETEEGGMPQIQGQLELLKSSKSAWVTEQDTRALGGRGLRGGAG